MTPALKRALKNVLAMAEEMSMANEYGHGDDEGNYLGPAPDVVRDLDLVRDWIRTLPKHSKPRAK